MPFPRDPAQPRRPGKFLKPPVTEVGPAIVSGTRVDANGEPTHRWVMVRVGRGHRFTPAEGPSAFYGVGRHYVRNDIAREIESAECRAAAEEYSFKDSTPVARLLLGNGRAVRVAPEELDLYLGQA